MVGFRGILEVESMTEGEKEVLLSSFVQIEI